MVEVGSEESCRAIANQLRGFITIVSGDRAIHVDDRPVVLGGITDDEVRGSRVERAVADIELASQAFSCGTLHGEPCFELTQVCVLACQTGGGLRGRT